MRSLVTVNAALAIAGAALGLGQPVMKTTYRKGEAPVRYRGYSEFVPPPTNGKREVARRFRQIQKGQLKHDAA